MHCEFRNNDDTIDVKALGSTNINVYITEVQMKLSILWFIIAWDKYLIEQKLHLSTLEFVFFTKKIPQHKLTVFFGNNRTFGQLVCTSIY